MTSPGEGSTGNWFKQSHSRDGELALAESGERLPWLESDDDGEEPAGMDTGRLIGIALIMLVALAIVVGGVWYLSHSVGSDEPEADGSLIAAPQTPYKERPRDPGGKTFAGTGDLSYAVGEGQAVEARLGTPTPTPTVTPTPETAPVATPTAKASPEESDDERYPAGTAVQVGAYSSRSDAEAGWATLIRRTELLSGISHRVIRGRADIGTVYRLQAGGGDSAGARQLCNSLKDAGIACQVK
ncbi:SPOR domain-containing protein [Qipengyuania sp.]|uniref:SPOR domain-containing protein n=1 Tax=Qipengyuania sp. TaxID=2004515 RepID=UPI0035C7D591